MRLRILGCAGGAGGGHYTISALVNDAVTLDIGTGFHQLTLDEMGAVKDVLISHAHLDHTAMLCFWVDYHAIKGNNVTIHCLQETADSIRTNFFNDSIWPNMENIMIGDKPAVHFNIIKPFQTVTIGEISITPLPVQHGLPTLAFCLHGDRENFVFCADMIDAPETFWQYLNTLDNFHSMTMEISFPNEMEKLAKQSYHLTPQMLEQLVTDKLPPTVNILYNHNKVCYVDTIQKQAAAILKGRIRPLVMGEILTF